MSEKFKLSRRDFLKTGAAASGGLLLGVSLSGCDQPFPHASGTDLQPNAFLQVTPAGAVILQLHKVEMGQGTYTGISTLVAEELDMNPGDISVEHAHFHPDFRDPEMQMMMTGASTSMKTSFEPLRQAAATVKALLVAAAAQQWGVSAESVVLRDGVVSGPQDRTAGIGELVETARGLPIPKKVALKKPEDYRFIGRQEARLDALAKVTGQAQFGLDATLPGTLVAVMRRCPHLGGKVKRFDGQSALAVKGVRQVLAINGGVAVVADGYWAARKGAGLVEVEWDKGPLAGVSSDSLLAHQRELVQQSAKNVREEGEAAAATGERIDVEYHVPHLSHCPMEPPNALARVTADKVELWSGSQVPDTVVAIVAAALERPREQVVLYNQLLGGGFGRRLMPDYAVEAALIAREMKVPVRLMWSREDDVRHDYYRPNALVNMSATVEEGRVTSLQSKMVVPSLFGRLMPMYAEASMPEWLPPAIPRALGGLARHADTSATEGIGDTDYQFPYLKVDWVRDDTPVPVGFWRSVGHSQNAFFLESFIDELADRTGADPVAFRLEHLPPSSPRHRALRMAAELADWGNPPAGQYQGVAVQQSFGTTVAQVATVSVEAGDIRVHRVVCVVDCGLAVNPDVVRMQMESGIIFGLSAALKGRISFVDGAVQESNFHDYPMMRLNETPDIEVHIVDSSEPPTGVGEPGVPPIAPAVANAVFAATGQRLRQLPLQLA